jgi:hypothetical protein
VKFHVSEPELRSRGHCCFQGNYKATPTKIPASSSSANSKYWLTPPNTMLHERTSTDGKGIGSTTGMGICHSYAPDGRCISLLKILLTISLDDSDSSIR